MDATIGVEALTEQWQERRWYADNQYENRGRQTAKPDNWRRTLAVSHRQRIAARPTVGNGQPLMAVLGRSRTASLGGKRTLSDYESSDLFAVSKRASPTSRGCRLKYRWSDSAATAKPKSSVARKMFQTRFPGSRNSFQSGPTMMSNTIAPAPIVQRLRGRPSSIRCPQEAAAG